MEAEKILKAIESVNHDDKDALAAIDKMVCEYLGKIPKPISPYTTSRDALKSIRPLEHTIMIVQFRTQDGCIFGCKLDKGSKFINGSPLKTEELAELYVIIKAIEYDRNN